MEGKDCVHSTTPQEELLCQDHEQVAAPHRPGHAIQRVIAASTSALHLRHLCSQLGALITPAILWPMRIDNASLNGCQVPAPFAALLATNAKPLFFGGMMFVVILVIFSKERAGRVFVETLLTVRGIMILHVKKGCLVCEGSSTSQALAVFEVSFSHDPHVPPCPGQAHLATGRELRL